MGVPGSQLFGGGFIELLAADPALDLLGVVSGDGNANIEKVELRIDQNQCIPLSVGHQPVPLSFIEAFAEGSFEIVWHELGFSVTTPHPSKFRRSLIANGDSFQIGVDILNIAGDTASRVVDTQSLARVASN